MPEPSNTYPGSLTVLSGETLSIGSDFSQNIVAGQTPSSPTAVLMDITNGEPGTVVTLAGSPTLVGNVVAKTVTGLTAGHTYRFLLGLTAAAGVIWQTATIIECPY